MTASKLRRRLLAGEILLGTLIVSPSPRWPDAVRTCGLDFVFIDTEHITLDRMVLSWMCQTYAAMGLPPLVRIPSPDPYAATMVLDGGASGVIAPYVETPEEVRALKGAVKLRPIKGSKLRQMIEGAPIEPELESYLGKSAEDRLLIVNIESVPAIQALDSILAVPGLDGVLIGPHDLSCSLGLPERYDHPDFLAACDTICRKARAAGLAAGIHYWGDAAQQARFLRMGVNLLIHSGDMLIFKTHLQAELAAIRQAAGLTQQSQTKQADLNI